MTRRSNIIFQFTLNPKLSKFCGFLTQNNKILKIELSNIMISGHIWIALGVSNIFMKITLQIIFFPGECAKTWSTHDFQIYRKPENL